MAPISLAGEIRTFRRLRHAAVEAVWLGRSRADQLDSSLAEPLSEFSKRCLAAQRLCDAIICDGIRRSNDSVRFPLGQKSPP